METKWTEEDQEYWEFNLLMGDRDYLTGGWGYNSHPDGKNFKRSLDVGHTMHPVVKGEIIEEGEAENLLERGQVPLSPPEGSHQGNEVRTVNGHHDQPCLPVRVLRGLAPHKPGKAAG